MTAEINKKLPSGAGHHQKKKKSYFLSLHVWRITMALAQF